MKRGIQITILGLWLLVGIAMLVQGCRQKDMPGDTGNPLRSVYYWSTTFELDSSQMAFIHRESIERIYLRYFDVVADGNRRPMPNASVRFLASRPLGVEVVPTIYILNECMSRDAGNLDSLLLGRILQMNETHDIDSVREIQIDCDWTMTTRKHFFTFLERLHERAKAHGLKISATIRLHQLSQPAPPVDRGVLMMYNTGDVTRLGATNPILDMHDVEPYLRRLKDYSLPLSTAYPVFAWRVVFRYGRYVGILHADDELPILQGDTIVEQSPSLKTVMDARRAVDKFRRDANREIILFDLSETNVKRINKEHYEKVFGH